MGTARFSPGSQLAVMTVVANRSYGGAERHVADLSQELARRGHRVACVCPESSRLGRILTGTVEVFELPGGPRPARFLSHLRHSLRAFRPDVVHLHGPRATLLGRLVALGTPRKARPVFVSTAHGWIPGRLALRRIFETLYLATACLDDATIAVSRDTARRFGPRQDRVWIVPNGIPRGDVFPVPAEPPAGPPRSGPVRLGFIGRLSHEKGFDFALEAYAQALAALPGLPVELDVYGEGELLGPAKEEVARAGLERVRFHGWVEPKDVSGVMAGLTALLLTSREEGLPYVLLEAMAAGCPVLASAVGGIPEVIENGKTGWLFRCGDVPAAAAAITALARDPLGAQRVRRAAWERAGEFSLGRMVDGVEAVYRAALERVGRSTARGPAGTRQGVWGRSDGVDDGVAPQ